MQRTSRQPRRRARRNIQIVVALTAAAALLAACSNAGQGVELAAGQDVKPAAAPTAAASLAPSDALPAATAAPAMASSTQTAEASTLPTALPSPTPTGQEEQPPLLTRMLQQYGYDIAGVDASQLLMLAYDNGASTLYLYDRDSAGLWRLTHSFAAQVGRNGVTSDKAEGDGKTPTGCYALGFAFGNSSQPDTAWPYRSVTPDSYWVDDPASASYNTWVEDTGARDWDSAEHLSDFSAAYAYALVIEYNMHPVVPGRGSAIFLHCGSHPTSSCIAVRPADMLTLLKWLDAGSSAHILIADVG